MGGEGGRGMSYQIDIATYRCNGCGKEITIKVNKNTVQFPNNLPSLEINCPLNWDWTSPSEYSKNHHYCDDEYCQKKLQEDRAS